MSDTTFSLNIASVRTNVHELEPFLERIRTEFEFDEDMYSRSLIALTEAVNNAIIHGNKDDPDKLVYVRCRCSPDRIEYVVRDSGKGFDPENLSDPTREENLLREGGRGVYIIKTVADEYEFHRKPEGMEVVFRVFRRTPKE
ncbi:MAG: ATP-binding protein [Chlorobi bacterium]|nr:ATP-binding protein [Chlorobiota bacterium]